MLQVPLCKEHLLNTKNMVLSVTNTTQPPKITIHLFVHTQVIFYYCRKVGVEFMIIIIFGKSKSH